MLGEHVSNNLKLLRHHICLPVGKAWIAVLLNLVIVNHGVVLISQEALQSNLFRFTAVQLDGNDTMVSFNRISCSVVLIAAEQVHTPTQSAAALLLDLYC